MTTSRLREIAANSDNHYRLHKRINKPDGSVREIYDVKEPLKSLQQKINQLFSKRCEYPDYLTGALPTWTYYHNAGLHAGMGTVITIDATNFFPSISQNLVKSIWNDFYKFDEDVAQLLAQLCCHEGRLAQGSPPSSYLANLAFWNIEPLIVKEFRARGYTYSRYVDDICVSHKRHLSPQEKNWAIRTAQKVFLSRSMKVKSKKTKVMDRNKRQEVNKRTVNSGRVCASRSLKNELRARVHRFSSSLTPPSSNSETRKEYASLKGKLHHFMQFNRPAARKLLDQLEEAYRRRTLGAKA